MAAPTLVIGVGGTGVRVLLRVKERFLEAYDEVPQDVILYELDTDNYGARRDTFNGVGLLVKGDRDEDRVVGPGEAEFYHVASKDITQTLDTVLGWDKKGEKKKGPEWQWVNEDLLGQTLTRPEDRVIHAGARTVRPVGRCALFLDYSSVYSNLQSRLLRVATRQQDLLQEAGVAIDAGDTLEGEKKKAAVFVVASVAGGSGAGMVIDILRMIEHMRNQEGALQAAPISVMTLLVGGSSFTDQRGERTDSNTFAALRELDRLGAVAGRALNRAVSPVMWAPQPVGRFTSKLGPADMILLFDKPDRLGRDRDVPRDVPNAYLELVIAPTLADLIMAFADKRIAPEISSARADLGELQRKDPKDANKPGHFPYASAGLHTLIFPERDVRRSAGLRFLLELWDDLLVRAAEKQSATDDDLPPATRELWGEDRPGDSKLAPYVFTDEGFQRSNVCKGAANNNFTQTVVTSAVSKQIQLPSASKFLGLFGGRSMVRRVLALVGLPNIGADEVHVERVADRLERDIDRSIEELDRCNNDLDVKEWRRRYLGAGNLGNETGGLWIEWLEGAESVRGHRADFRDVLQKVVTAILNDADHQGRRLPYRLEYARWVLDRLEQHILRLTQGDPRDPTQGSLLSDYFIRQINAEERPRNRVSKWEPYASRGEKFGTYLRANKDYAKAKKELVGKRLLEVLCEDLLSEVTTLRDKLDKWQRLLRDTRRLLAEEQTRHEGERLKKVLIPVRTYVTDRPRDGYFKDGAFEQGLYERHRQEATDEFRKAIKWVWRGDQFDLEAPFGKSPSEPLSEAKLVERANTWACTRKGNPDRPDAIPPLRDLGSTAEVNMAVRIRDYFGVSGAQALSNLLTAAPYLASLCPLDDWPEERRMYALGLPKTASAEDGVDAFYTKAVQEINSATEWPAFRERRLMIFDPENPRHAVAAEFAFGFKLQHRRDQESYTKAYRNDTNQYFALHCLPEEDRASTYYELVFKPDSEGLYKGLDLDPMLLDPAVVDVLGNKERLELFVKALAIRVIRQLPQEQREIEGADFYLWPRTDDLTRRIRLSQMNAPEEIRTIARDLAPTADKLQDITQDKTAINRLRLMFALRTFILLERDVDKEQRNIPYDDIYREVTRVIDGISRDKRIEAYKKWTDRFLEYYREYRDRYPMLAHLGLVLARVADDLRYSEEHKGV